MIHEMDDAQARARIAHHVTLASMADEIAVTLLDAYELSGSPAGNTARKVMNRQAIRAVALTQPSRHEMALGAAHVAQRDTIAQLLDSVVKKYEDNSNRDLIRRALFDLAMHIDRLGPHYVLAAYEGSLEGAR